MVVPTRRPLRSVRSGASQAFVDGELVATLDDVREFVGKKRKDGGGTSYWPARILMIAAIFDWVSIPVALFIGSIGAASVVKAVYIDKRELKCACVVDSSNVPSPCTLPSLTPASNSGDTDMDTSNSTTDHSRIGSARQNSSVSCFASPATNPDQLVRPPSGWTMFRAVRCRRGRHRPLHCFGKNPADVAGDELYGQRTKRLGGVHGVAGPFDGGLPVRLPVEGEDTRSRSHRADDVLSSSSTEDRWREGDIV